MLLLQDLLNLFEALCINIVVEHVHRSYIMNETDELILLSLIYSQQFNLNLQYFLRKKLRDCLVT